VNELQWTINIFAQISGEEQNDHDRAIGKNNVRTDCDDSGKGR
jgi:hypothetical protein